MNLEYSKWNQASYIAATRLPLIIILVIQYLWNEAPMKYLYESHSFPYFSSVQYL